MAERTVGDGNGWTRCALGHRHWGLFGAAGLLVTDGIDVLLQHRAAWTHEGDTWSLPGGARDSHETAVQTALREAVEETSLDPRTVQPVAAWTDDHQGWSYTTIVAVTAARTAVAPANTSPADDTVVVYGKADAPHTLSVYEDFRCPVCQAFETSAGKTVQQLADQGDYKIEYHLATFLDGNLGGKGSKTALAAAGAALNEGVDKFKAFHDVLYANQPAESEDGFGDVNHLLDLAGQVPGLKTEAFTKAVTDGTYKGWAAKVSTAFNKSGVSGTPTVKLDGKQLAVIGQDGKPLTGDQFTALVKQTIGG
ncbi:MAG: thioredoxin domain-containing protein [Streptomyces sp.]|jgi:protein-disulfide isomerase|nr:thioredoxin domain-containing protein [Streptomyces sp.]